MHRASRRWALVVAFVLAASSSLAAGAPQAADRNSTRPDEEQLIQRLKQEILKEFLEGDLLRQQIELGIKDYVKREQDARAAARATQVSVASEKAKKVRPVSRDRDHVYGNPEAAISLIEYSDFECPYCKRFHRVAKEIVDAYAGRVNWVYRHFPLSFHNPGAQQQAEASECADQLGGNDAFWRYADAIYARTTSNGKGFPLTRLTPLATEIGLDADAFQACLDGDTHAARVHADVTEGSQIGVTGTPATILLHNRTGAVRLRVGAQPVAAFKEDIDAMLE